MRSLPSQLLDAVFPTRTAMQELRVSIAVCTGCRFCMGVDDLGLGRDGGRDPAVLVRLGPSSHMLRGMQTLQVCLTLLKVAEDLGAMHESNPSGVGYTEQDLPGETRVATSDGSKVSRRSASSI